MAVVLVALCAWASPAAARVHSWQGPDNGYWSVASNWVNDDPPESGETAVHVLVGSAGSSRVDIDDLDLDQLVLSGDHHVNDGGAGTLGIADGGLIANAGDGNELNVDLALDPGSKIGVYSESGTFGLGSVITGGAEVRFTGEPGAGTKYTGSLSTAKTVVASGVLSLDDSTENSTAITSGTVSVGETFVADGVPELKLVGFEQIGDAANVTVGTYGFFDVTGETIGSLTVNGGAVEISARLKTSAGADGVSAPGVSMTGGFIDGNGSLVTRGITATSSASSSAEITRDLESDLNGGTQMNVNVTPGPTQPELKLGGEVRPVYASAGSIFKSGGGTLLVSGTNSLPGINVSAGTLVMNGSQGPVSGTSTVSSGATLTGTGTLGNTVVSGRLVPGVPAFRTRNLSFSPTGSLHLGAVGATVPRVSATGTVTIDPAAGLSGTLPAVPAGTQHTAIANDLADGVAGQFATTGGTVFTTPLGQPYTAAYTGGDGNDVVVTAGDVPVAATPPAAPPSNGTGTVADRTKPTLGAFTFSASTFRAATSGGSTSQRKKKAPTGTKVAFTLSEASSVKFTVQRKTRGRRVKGKCKAATRGNRSKPRCTLWKNVAGSFTVRGKAGKNSFTFRGRVGGKALKPGSYRLNGTATDPSRNASLPKQKAFTIVR